MPLARFGHAFKHGMPRKARLVPPPKAQQVRAVAGFGFWHQISRVHFKGHFSWCIVNSMSSYHYFTII